MLRCYTKDNDQEFEEIYNLAMSLTVENDHATVVRATSSKFWNEIWSQMMQCVWFPSFYLDLGEERLPFSSSWWLLWSKAKAPANP